MSFNTPILFLVFNRPESTQQVINAISVVKPANLFIAADGPRVNKKNENKLCSNVRDIVMKSITWHCEVKTLFREKNLGCGLAVSEAITWFFGQVDQGIILEDDCLPSTSFFEYCEILLERYKNYEKIGMISGNNFRLGELPLKESYGFTKYPHIWGWATWKRAWALYDYKMKSWENDIKNGLLQKVFKDQDQVNYWAKTFCEHRSANCDTWDYQWSYACWKHDMLSIEPSLNLIQNIGFSDDATHTNCDPNTLKYGNQKSNSISIQEHPIHIVTNEDSDNLTFLNRYYKPLLTTSVNLKNNSNVSKNYFVFKHILTPNKLLKIKNRCTKSFSKFISIISNSNKSP